MQYLAKQSADGMRLEPINPWQPGSGPHKRFEQSKQSFLTDDPTVVAGEKYQGEDYEPIWQWDNAGNWIDKQTDLFGGTCDYRQILRRKAQGEKDDELPELFDKQQIKEFIIQMLTEMMPDKKEYDDFKGATITEAIEWSAIKHEQIERLVYLRAISEIDKKLDRLTPLAVRGK